MNRLTPLIFWCLLLCGMSMSPALVANTVEIRETITNGFTHPGIGLTKGMLDDVRELVRAKREPWYSSYQAMASSPNSRKEIEIINQSDSDPTRPNLTKFNDRNIMKQLDYDAEKAYRQALMYYFTGDVAHRANAMNIIRIWCQLDTDSFTSFHASHIHVPYPVKDLVMAAELMRYTDSPDPKYAWTEQDTENLTNNLLIPCIDTYMYSNGFFMNQSGYPLAGAMACYIFMNDREGYEKRVEWFTVNKDAPNKGYSSSILDLFRLVETDALTKRRVSQPFVQLMEMGRDQAHAGGDLEIACNTARMMNAQGTKVDPKRGTVSTESDAVGAYEFLDNRILAAADYYSRFMLGYDTPWTPSPSDMDSDGVIHQIYSRLSDNYRGRIRIFHYGDLYYYYTYEKGINLAEAAPYYLDMFEKRVKMDDFEWLYIPPEATGEGARIIPTQQEPDRVQIALRSTHFGNGSIAYEHDQPYLKFHPSAEGTRLALLSIKTPSKDIGLTYRSSGVVILEMEGFKEPWLLPDTQGEWMYVPYTMPPHEHVEDIIFVHAKGAPETQLDLAEFVRKPNDLPDPPVLMNGHEPLLINAYVGLPVTLDFSEGNTSGIIYESLNKPEGATIGETSGLFTWTPQNVNRHSFSIQARNGKVMVARQLVISVAKDRNAAMAAMRSVYDQDALYTNESLEKCVRIYKEAMAKSPDMDDAGFWTEMLRVQKSFHQLKILTPTLADGSMDYPPMVVESNIGNSIGFLIDGNDDTFPTDGNEDMNFVFDFGEDYKVAFTAFSLEGRINFDDRSENSVFYGSNDKKEWTELTDPTELSSEMVTVKVARNRQEDRFRYMRVKRNGSRFFEPSELRIYGTRHNTE